ncbi:hypothetical protein GWI33_016794 [Rhynchophorus ferrugineus]|uniref:Protein kinase domain-containing protein n=1 Tax=Rhynchophorus ferrugineus TaxID=354439 RepID=A0A834I0I3_RHYFE|nr:hypothetical protein GWI33_016794 [Rhynchophorus ferrugineus]
MSGLDFCTPKKPSLNILKKIQIPPSPYMKKIGYGTGVAVYELERSPVFDKFRSPWAIKKLITRKRSDPTIKTRLKNEAEVLRKLIHPNIVGFRAFLESKDGNNILAMEECNSSLGDLIEIRGDDNKGPFSSRIIAKVSLDVAHALNYLHNNALIIHCDIKSYNVLIKGDFNTCKLCDFGVCLPIKKNGNLDVERAPGAEYIGTQAWSAPEILKYPQDITTKADIYSYGLIIWEMIALCPPISENIAQKIQNYSGMNQVEFDKILEEISVKTRPPLPEHINLGEDYKAILEVFFCCTEENKGSRPSAADLTVILDEVCNRL